MGSGAALPLGAIRAALRRSGVKAAFVGATRGMGRALARRMAGRGDALCLLGRDPAELRLSARDLEIRGAPAPVTVATRGGGTVCAFSSVAGDRARRSNYLYGASKAGLSAFLDGLGHAYAQRGVRVVCVKPGFVRTGMTAGLPEPPFTGEPDAVAGTVLRAMDRGCPVVYAPGVWRWIMLAVRALPRAVMRRIEL